MISKSDYVAYRACRKLAWLRKHHPELAQEIAEHKDRNGETKCPVMMLMKRQKDQCYGTEKQQNVNGAEQCPDRHGPFGERRKRVHGAPPPLVSVRVTMVSRLSVLTDIFRSNSGLVMPGRAS